MCVCLGKGMRDGCVLEQSCVAAGRTWEYPRTGYDSQFAGAKRIPGGELGGWHRDLGSGTYMVAGYFHRS